MVAILDALLGDYFDAILVVVVLVVAIVLALLPAVVAYLGGKFLGPIGAAVGLVLFAPLTYFYYDSFPTDYVSHEAWRAKAVESMPDGPYGSVNAFNKNANRMLAREAEGGQFTEPSVLHFNVQALASMDSFMFLRFSGSVYEDDDPGYLKLIKIIGAIIGLPGMIVKWILYKVLWTPVLWALAYTSPYLLGVLGAGASFAV